jgi:hypothetical protein
MTLMLILGKSCMLSSGAIMENLRKTVAGAFIAATLLGGTAATPAFAGGENHKDPRPHSRHYDKYDDCEKKSYWRDGEKKYYWDCNDNGKYDKRYDHEWNGDKEHDHRYHHKGKHDDGHDHEGRHDHNGKYNHRDHHDGKHDEGHDHKGRHDHNGKH